MSIAIEVNGGLQIEAIQRHIEKLNNKANQTKLLNLIGIEAENQTHQRLRNDKTAPDGSPWEAWSTKHASTRHGNHSLLSDSGELDDSIQYIIKGGNVHLGSNLPYANVLQNGFKGKVNVPAHTRLITQAFGRALKHPVYQNIKTHSREMLMPQREYLGFSSENKKQLLSLIGNFYGELL